jgi:hypothetical protein
MAAASATAARQAVIAALTTVTGKPRALPEASLFRSSLVSKAKDRTISARVNKRAFVLFSDAYIEPGANEFGSIIKHFYTVTVECRYAMGSDLFADETNRALDVIDADQPLIRAALCAPGALVGCGLDGDALRSDAYRTQGPTPPRNENGERVLTVTHFFTASIDITQPT